MAIWTIVGLIVEYLCPNMRLLLWVSWVCPLCQSKISLFRPSHGYPSSDTDAYLGHHGGSYLTARRRKLLGRCVGLGPPLLPLTHASPISNTPSKRPGRKLKALPLPSALEGPICAVPSSRLRRYPFKHWLVSCFSSYMLRTMSS